jgi:SAM-dependent methyltransferase
MEYVYSRPNFPSFTGKGLAGYAFGPLKQKNLAIDYVNVESGHDTFMISGRIIRTYFIISGSGYFTIEDNKYPVVAGMLVEIPTKVEYSYSGQMALLLFQSGRWLPDNDTHTKWNPDVLHRNFPPAENLGWSLARLAQLRVLGKSPIGAYLRVNRALWNTLPTAVTTFAPVRRYGSFLHALARMHGVRAQAFATHFFRNRSQIELIGRLADRERKAGALRVAVLGCSTGAEVYSIAWRIRSARPDLKMILQAVDLSKPAVEIGKSGVYSLVGTHSANLFERMTKADIDELFDRDGYMVTVKSWIREGMDWHVADAADGKIVDLLGHQDILVANNFLCHMDPPNAERCLRNIARLVDPGGYLIVSGIDLDVRTKVAGDLEWQPLQELLEEIHDGDPAMKNFWPFQYGGLEPLDRGRRDWRLRYATAFRLIGSRADEPKLEEACVGAK